MISDEKELAATAKQAGNLLQEIQDHLGPNSSTNGKVAFPTGFLRRKASIESTLPAVRNPKHTDSLTKNICYTLIEADVLRWLLMRTNLRLVAQRMVIKEIMRILGDVCDCLMVDALYQKRGPKNNYKERTERLTACGVINADLRDDLDWLWEQRVKVHLWQLTESEYDDGKYNAKQYARAYKAYEGLVTALTSSNN